MNKLSLHERLSLKGKKFQSMNILHYPIWLFVYQHIMWNPYTTGFTEIVSDMCSKQRHAGKNYSNEGMIFLKNALKWVKKNTAWNEKRIYVE